MIDLDKLETHLTALSAELKELGTPFVFRRDVKAVIDKLPAIRAARAKKQ